MKSEIAVYGAREHNLKNVDVKIPRNKLVVLTGISGSGKSSLAFDTIYAEGQRRYVESLSSYARQFLGQAKKPDVDRIDGSVSYTHLDVYKRQASRLLKPKLINFREIAISATKPMRAARNSEID